MSRAYDAIVVGARCAGSPTAMLLARKGYRVLVVDKATFPSDTISTHLVHPPGIAALRALGPARRRSGDGMPADRHLCVRLRPLHDLRSARDRRDAGRLLPLGARCSTSCSSTPRPRRAPRFARDSPSRSSSSTTAASTGIRGHGKGGETVTERAKVVIGADGRHSLVAEAVRPEQYNEKPPLLASYYTYWSGLPMDGRFETYIRPERGFAAWPTNDDLTLVIAGWPFAEFEANKKDIEGNYLQTLELAPAFADRVRGAKREERFVGTAVPQLLPQALRPRLGAGRRCRLQQGLHHGAGNPGRVPRRRAVRQRARRVVRRRRRPFDDAMGEYQSRTRRARPADVRVHLPSSQRSSPRRPSCSSAGRRARQPGGDGRVRARRRRSDLTGRVLLGRERRTDSRRCCLGHRLRRRLVDD